MIFIPTQDTLVYLLSHFGGGALFLLMALGVFALPVPDEFLLILAGYLISQNVMSGFSTVLLAQAGSLCGISLSYTVGRTVGRYLLLRYGRRAGVTIERLNTVRNWYKRYGKFVLTFGFFFPGIRHVTALFAGASNMEYRPFALYAYTGSFLWVSTFLILGYFVGGVLLPYLPIDF